MQQPPQTQQACTSDSNMDEIESFDRLSTSNISNSPSRLVCFTSDNMETINDYLTAQKSEDSNSNASRLDSNSNSSSCSSSSYDNTNLHIEQNPTVAAEEATTDVDPQAFNINVLASDANNQLSEDISEQEEESTTASSLNTSNEQQQTHAASHEANSIKTTTTTSTATYNEAETAVVETLASMANFTATSSAHHPNSNTELSSATNETNIAVESLMTNETAEQIDPTEDNYESEIDDEDEE